MFKVLKTDGAARRGEFSCPHGTVQTPVFMNVGTQAAIKGALSAADLETIGTQVELSNTYHLHLRPGDEVVRDMGGLHKFMTWDGPILTDSGGFQVFSLAGLRKIKEEGVTFASHLDGHKIFMGPEESMRIQSNLGSDIAMAFDECVENPATYPYAKASCERTARWLARCKEALTRYNAEPGAVNPGQQLWGINQGATFKDLRIWHMQEIAKLNLPGYAIGGLAVGDLRLGAFGGGVLQIARQHLADIALVERQMLRHVDIDPLVRAVFQRGAAVLIGLLDGGVDIQRGVDVPGQQLERAVKRARRAVFIHRRVRVDRLLVVLDDGDGGLRVFQRLAVNVLLRLLRRVVGRRIGLEFVPPGIEADIHIIVEFQRGQGGLGLLLGHPGEVDALDKDVLRNAAVVAALQQQAARQRARHQHDRNDNAHDQRRTALLSAGLSSRRRRLRRCGANLRAICFLKFSHSSSPDPFYPLAAEGRLLSPAARRSW